MPRFVNWLLRLLITNPICMRLIQGGSRRLRHLYIRSAYLGIMIVVLLFVLLQSVADGAGSMRDLAAGGATMFEYVSILQVALICILAPVFMAGAIAQEANPRTWDILLTSPLNALQIVLGNLFGRLFFILALLLSSLPLFAVTQYFGGVRLNAIFASYAIAGTSALLVAAIAITLSVTRTAGRRAVFIFYVTVIMYLFVTYAIDVQFLRMPIAAGAAETHTTLMTPLNPFLALLVLLRSNEYVPHDVMDISEHMWLVRWWLSQPIAAFCWVCVLLSTILIGFSTIRLRAIGAKEGATPWYRRMFGLAAKGAMERPPRPVGKNPVAWREAVARGKSFLAVLSRWGFCAAGVLIAVVFMTMYHVGLLSGGELQTAILTVVGAEIMIITLAALNLSATAVTREREDGTLDIILTTPIQPGPYIAGKLSGLIQFLLPMILVPVMTLLLMAGYVLTNGLGGEQGGTTNIVIDNVTVDVPLILPEAAILLPLMFAPFIAFCVMVGLQWSIKSKGTISAVIAAVGIIMAVVGVVSLCGYAGGQSLSVIGAMTSAFSPGNMIVAVVRPEIIIDDALERSGLAPARVALAIGAIIAAGAYAALVYGMHTNMKRTFMMTVRKLAGTN